MDASTFLCSKLGLSKVSGGSGISISIRDPSSVFSGSTSRPSLMLLVVFDVVLFLMFSQSQVTWRGYGISCDLINVLCRCSTGRQPVLHALMKRFLMIHILCSYCEDVMLIVCCGRVVML